MLEKKNPLGFSKTKAILTALDLRNYLEIGVSFMSQSFTALLLFSLGWSGGTDVSTKRSVAIPGVGW